LWLALLSLFLASEVGVRSTSFWAAHKADQEFAVLAQSFSFAPVGAPFLWIQLSGDDDID